SAKMGKEFGNLMKTRHIVTYYLSPFEQKLCCYWARCAAGPIQRRDLLGAWNCNVRKDGLDPLVLSSPRCRKGCVQKFVIGYMIYSWANDYNKKLKRKNPADYENDV
ncbi:hypothetical protein Chor_005110, partial [Crotalus horridus]